MTLRHVATRLAVLMAALALPASAQTPVPLSGAVPVEGHRTDLDRLAGEWIGEYACPETGRQGTIVFRLGAGADSVQALVLMVPRATNAVPFPAVVPLELHHVAVEGRGFQGSLVRYDDPELAIPLETEFGGMLAHSGHIEGYFRAFGRQVDTVVQCGRWWADRVPDPPLRP